MLTWRFLKARRARAKFGKDQNGASAVEFAIVAFPFIALLLCLIEVAMIAFTNFMLDNATDQAARLIRTGQATGFSAGQFKQAICDRITAPIDCGASLRVDVKKYQNFTSVALTQPLDAQGNVRESFAFEPGQGGDVIVVRVFYEWPLIAKVISGLDNMANGNHMMISTAAFRNEPFGNPS